MKRQKRKELLQTTIIKPAMAEHILEICPTATASWYEDVGHAPFLEEPARFNRELAELVHRVRP
jgi:pimeloyl-ACP methyl ester carboxylesterase